jgi:hypothetical protein
MDNATHAPLGPLANPGYRVYDTSTLTSPTELIPTGTVSYTFFKEGTCASGTEVGTDVVQVAQNGSVPPSSVSDPVNAAEQPYAYSATYSGDRNFQRVTADCEIFQDDKRQPSITTILSSSQIMAGESVHDTAALLGVVLSEPSTVNYKVYSDSSCTQLYKDLGDVVVVAPTLVIVNATAPNSAEISFPDPGIYYFQASYSGDINNFPAKSECQSERLVVQAIPVGPVQAGEAPLVLRALGGAGGPLLGVLLGLSVLGTVLLVRRRSAR